MKNYYYNENGKQVGPISLEELKGKRITKETLVWYEGLDEWKKAFDIEELKSIFPTLPPLPKASEPPPFPKKTPEKEIIVVEKKNEKSSTQTTLTILGAIFLLVVVGILISKNMNTSAGSHEPNNSSSNSVTTNTNTYQEPPRQKTPEELKKELLEQERVNPTKYLSQSGTWRENFGGQIVLEGTIYNTATMASFKDVVLEVVWLTKTKTSLKTEYYTVYEFFGPRKNKTYKIKATAPNSTGGVQISVNSATAVY